MEEELQRSGSVLIGQRNRGENNQTLRDGRRELKQRENGRWKDKVRERQSDRYRVT